MVNTKSASVSSRYATFLANKMNEKEKPNYRQRLNATGAAKRALAGDEQIKALIPAEDASLLGNKAIVTWDVLDDMEENVFIVTVKNIFDEEIMKEEVTGNAVALDFSSEQMQNEEGLWIINVRAKENQDVTSGDIAIKRPENPDQYAEGLNSLKAEVDEESALNKIIYASFLRRKWFNRRCTYSYRGSNTNES